MRIFPPIGRGFVCNRYGKVFGLIAALAMSSAWAADGRIDFVGTIVMPTCTARAEPAAVTTGDVPSGRTFACDDRSQATEHTNSSVYRLSVTNLDGVSAAGCPLLQYFIGYRASAHAADTRMVTRIYE